jgi:PAS domain S-box-containing protein
METKARLAALVESSDDAIVGKDLDGVITSWNSGAERLFGYTAAEAVGQPITMLIPVERQGEEPQILDRIRRGERIEHFETVRRRKDGTTVEISLTVSPVMDPSGKVVGASKIARDITERRRAEADRARLLESERLARAEAERAGRFKDEFLATLSHELRTPLNAILGWSKLIDKDPTNQEMVNEGIQVITRNAKVQADLISDLLDMSRIISGKMRLDVEFVELSAVVRAAVDSVRPAAEAKQVRLQPIISSIAEPVRGDPNRLQQITWNLLTNAIKFTPKGGTVRVVLAKKNSHAEIQISDTGKGIEPEFLPFIFDRFRQADASTTREHGGLGLGLAIVKQLVELHGGHVRADSRGKGQGSAFTVELPLAVVHATGPVDTGSYGAGPSLPFEIDLRGIRVLAVDDEPDARHLLRRILEDRKAEALIAASGREAFDILNERSADVILCDIGMPDMDGYEFIRRLRESQDSTPAVALTAFARSEDRTRALVSGFQGHVAKPVEPNELVATVAALSRSLSREKNNSRGKRK